MPTPLTPNREPDLGPLESSGASLARVVQHGQLVLLESTTYPGTSFEPGPRMGGHCLPVDPFYLTWRAREFQMATEFIEFAGKINQHMPSHCVERIERALNDAEKPVRGTRIAVLGVGYKGGSSDIRESPALRIIQELAARGAILGYHDPFVPELPAHGMRSAELPELLSDSDAVVLVTAQPGVDHASIIREAELFIDLRGVTRGTVADNVVRLGTPMPEAVAGRTAEPLTAHAAPAPV